MNKFVKKLAEQVKQSKTSSYDTNATVSYVDGDTAYVKISGSDIEDTPCKMTISCKQGDIIKVRVSGGRAYIIGNESSPPTDDSYAEYKLAIIDKLIAKTVKVGEVVGDKFKLSADGVLTCKDAVLSGTINAIKGKIGNWVITDYDIDGNEHSSLYSEEISYDEDGSVSTIFDAYLNNMNFSIRRRYYDGGSLVDFKRIQIEPDFIKIYSFDGPTLELKGDKIRILDSGELFKVVNGHIYGESHSGCIGTVKELAGSDVSLKAGTANSIMDFSLDPGTWVVTATIDYSDCSSATKNHAVRGGFMSGMIGGHRFVIPSGVTSETTMTISWIFYPSTTTTYDIYASSTYARVATVRSVRAVRII